MVVRAVSFGPRFALSVRQPWAYAIMHMGKDVENRTWKPKHDITGERIWIHASSTREQYDPDELLAGFIHGDTHPRTEDLPAGAIVGSVVIHGFTRASKSRWFNPGRSNIGWLLREPEPVAKPVPCRGALGLWVVPAHVLETLAA